MPETNFCALKSKIAIFWFLNFSGRIAWYIYSHTHPLHQWDKHLNRPQNLHRFIDESCDIKCTDKSLKPA